MQAMGKHDQKRYRTTFRALDSLLRLSQFYQLLMYLSTPDLPAVTACSNHSNTVRNAQKHKGPCRGAHPQKFCQAWPQGWERRASEAPQREQGVPSRVFGENKSQRNGSCQIQVILAKFSNRLTDYTITDYLSKILKPINRLTLAHLLLQLIQFGVVQEMKKLLESPSGTSHTRVWLTLEAAHRNSLLIPPQKTCRSPTEEGRWWGAVFSRSCTLCVQSDAFPAFLSNPCFSLAPSWINNNHWLS